MNKKIRIFKILHFLSLLIILPVLITNICFALNNDNKVVYFGIMKYYFNEVNINDAKVAMNGWANEIGKEYKKKTGISIIPKISYFDDINEMKDLLIKKMLDVVVLSPYDYALWNFSEIIDPLMMDKPDESVVKVMLVNKNSKITSLNDLKSKKISIDPAIDGLYSIFWLNMIFKQNGINDHILFSEIEICKKSSMVIMQLFFGKATACITSLLNFKTNSEVNPQIKEKIKILLSSEKLINSMVGLRKDCKTINGNILTEVALNPTNNKSMKSMMELFKKAAIVRFNKEMLIPIEQLIQFNQNKIDKENSREKKLKSRKK